MNRKGITLIELLVALTISGILVGGVYRTFVSQQHTYTVQEQVVDMQQNVRLAINRMTRELRMAGFGGGGVNGWTSTEFFNHGAMYGAFNNVVNPGADATSVTVVEGYQTLIPTTMSVIASSGDKSIFVNDASSFDTGAKKYISINGVESHQITQIIGNEIRFPGWDKLTNDHQAGEPVYLVMAITYSHGVPGDPLMRNDHLGGGDQPVAENIYSLQFAYLDANGNPTANPPDIRMIQLNIIARTDKTDPDYKVDGGYRRRTLTTNIQLRNLAF
jgi:type IV pilus assembly protein PilW